MDLDSFDEKQTYLLKGYFLCLTMFLILPGAGGGGGGGGGALADPSSSSTMMGRADPGEGRPGETPELGRDEPGESMPDSDEA